MKNKFKSVIGNIIITLTFNIFRRKDKNACGRVVERVFHRLMSICGLSYFPMLSVELYKQKFNNVEISTIRNNRVGVEGNVVYSDELPKMELYDVDLPDIRLQKYHKVLVSGNSDVIIDKKNCCIVCDACYNMDPDLLFIDGLLYRDRENIGVLRNNLKHYDKSLDSAIMISGKFSNNYYHQLFENLIKLLLLEEIDIPIEVPILVDEVVYKKQSFQRILEILTKNSKRPIISIKPSQLLFVSTLYSFDHINRIISHIKKVDVYKKGLVAFDEYYISKFRQLLLSYKSKQVTPKRIFLTRENTNHRKFNEEEIFSILQPLGFEKIAPERYSFEQQMALFNNAEWIIGATGAAFTNIMFCNKGCNILSFRAVNKKTVFPEFSTLANINECHMVYYLATYSKQSNTAHSDFYIDKVLFEKYIKSIII